MTSSIALFCLIHGQPIKNAFPVQIEKTRTVGHLKEEILRKNLNAFHGVDAAMLILWKVHIEMKKDDINAVPDVPSTANDTAYELAPFEDIEDVFTDPKTKLFITPAPKHIHIIIQAPMQAYHDGSRPRKLQKLDELKIINVAGPLTSNKYLQYSPAQRQPIPEIFKRAYTSKPSIFYAPYQSGKTTCLRAIQDELIQRGIHAIYISLSHLHKYNMNLTYPDKFACYISYTAFREELDNKALFVRTQIEYGRSEGQTLPKACFLVDEIQALYSVPELASTAKSFFDLLDDLFIPYVGAGTFKVTDLEWETEDRMASPFNKAQFYRLSPLSPHEMTCIIEVYMKDWKVTVPEGLQLDMAAELGGHASSFMALIKFFHTYRSTRQTWRKELELNFLDCMNGVSKKIRRDLSDPVVKG